MVDSNYKEFFSCSELFDKISDITRIVDPLQKRVIEHKNNNDVTAEIHCFDFWGKNNVCDNCISMRAYNDNTTYVKIEYKKDKTYIITAVPYSLPNKRVVIEIIKDITKSLLLDANDGVVIEQASIHALIDNMNKLAYNDSLTGLYNRRYIMEKLPVDLLNAALLSNKISVIMADIDLFKNINDNYGHIAGDRTLNNVAKVLSGCIIRDTDWVARFGGEEFLICMPGASLEVARRTAESMRKSLEDSVIEFEGRQFSVTASFGICSLKSVGQESAEDLIKCADERLYLAKKNGRNRIEF